MEHHLLWLLPLTLVASYARLRDRPGEEEHQPGAGRAPWLGLLGLAAACVALRLGLALGRSTRSVDEHGYLALAWFARDAGESLFGCFVNLRAHVFLYLLGGSPRAAFAVADVAASLAVGAGGLALGWTVWTGLGRRGLALATVPLYTLGQVPFEGLSANAEPFACLFLSLYLAIRQEPPGPGWRSLLAGACLGGAALAKEQALVFWLLEPLLALLRPRSADPARRAGAGCVTALAGAAGVLLAWLLLFAWSGALGGFLGRFVRFGAGGGSPHGADLTPLVVAREPAPVGFLALDGIAALLWHPGTLLALVGATTWRAGSPARRRLLGACLLQGLLALLGASIGLRWFRHYFMLLVPALVPLAAVGAATVWRDLRPRRRARPWAAALTLVTLLLGLTTLRGLQLVPARSQGIGGPSPTQQAELERVCAVLRERVPPRAPIFVAGWRPEIYTWAARAPASRGVSGGMFDLDLVLPDLERRPPAAVVVPSPLLAVPLQRPILTRAGIVREQTWDDLLADPRFLDWLRARGYVQVWASPGCRILQPRAPASQR